jgi:two-component system, NtrC family, sensor kinase
MKGSVFTGRTWLLLSATLLLVVAGALNLSQRLKNQSSPPSDGVTWIDTAQGVVAKAIETDSAAARARIIPGDHVIAVSPNGHRCEDIARGPKCEPVGNSASMQMYLDRARVGGEIHYLIERPSWPPESRFYYADLDNLGSIQTWKTSDIYVNLIGLVYLCVGLFVIFKQGGRSPFVLHFATICLAAFVFHFYTPTGSYRDLDLAIAVLRNAGFILFAPVFLHFSAIYPVRYHLFDERRWRSVFLYLPALLLLAVGSVIFLRDQLVRVIPFAAKLLDYSPAFAARFYKISFVHFAAALAISAVLLIRRFIVSKNTVARQQLKWVVWGSVLAIVPFMLLYALGYVMGSEAGEPLTEVAVVPLVLIPLSFGYSVVRYRLMDVELVVRRVAVYAATTIAIALGIGAVVYAFGVYTLNADVSSSGEITVKLLASIALMAVIVMIAAPIKNFLQEQVDRLFYGRRYDLRQSLIDFGRTISASTALDPLLDSLITRLREVMNVERVAIFIEDENASSGYRAARTVGLSGELNPPPDFREMIRTRSAETGVVRADDLDLESENRGFTRRSLHYYVPCVVRGRMVAVIGLGRSADGALLSSEDVEILRTVSGYIAVAVENSLLYQEQRTRAAELELLKEFNESIVESINVGLLAVDLNGNITRLNSAMEQIFSISRDEAISKNVEDLFAEDFADTLRQVLGPDGWRLAQTRQIYKLHTATRAGRSLVLNVALAPLTADSDEQTGALVVFEDVTQRLQLEEQLQQREKLSSIGLLAAGVAHEVNTPLTGVSSYTQMLLGMLSENDPKHALLEKVRRQADRATDIVNNLLNFSRTGGAAEFNQVNIHRVLDDTLQLLEPQLRRSQISIVRDYGEELPQVHGNSVKLQQVFTNLILNARDSISNGEGRITLTTRNGEDGLVVVEVADNGIGIAPEHVAKIYDPFYTTKGVGGGTGLGLAVTYGIVQEHSGHISVASTPGLGTTFRISLPTNDPRARLQAAAL